MIQDERVRPLNDAAPRDGRYVLYWMQASQRARFNHALEFAIERANDLGRPLLACFGLTDGYPEANARHYAFMLEGLGEAEQDLKERNIKLAVRRGSPDEVALELSRDAALVVCDRGYLRHQRQWRKNVAGNASCPVVEVETDVVVPVEVASQKAEIAARTLRPRIHRHLGRFLTGLPHRSVDKSSMNLSVERLDLCHTRRLLAGLEIDHGVEPVGHLHRGGTSQALWRLKEFLEKSFPAYRANRNQPQTDDVSYMSMYLHFGQISPVEIALRVQRCGAPEEDIEAYLEELIVRRELAMNFVHYTRDYDSFSALPGWAAQTLQEHAKDRREHLYSLEDLERSRTHDPYWNAAMTEMRHTGYMHNYMRMYWGKKILEWTRDPQEAFRRTLYLNNRYFLDGRDPASFANVAWVFGAHDHGWKERPVFGKVRYMSASGLERKSKPQQYVQKVKERVGE